MRCQYRLVALLLAGCGQSRTHEYSAGVLPTAIVSCACVIPDAGPVGPAVSEWEEPFLTDYVQLTFAESFHKAGEAYFSPDGRWIIFQAVAKPAEGQSPDEHYAMYVAKLKMQDGAVVGLDDPILVSPPGTPTPVAGSILMSLAAFSLAALWCHPVAPMFPATSVNNRSTAGRFPKK